VKEQSFFCRINELTINTDCCHSPLSVIKLCTSKTTCLGFW